MGFVLYVFIVSKYLIYLLFYECKLTTKASHSTFMAPELIFAMISFTGCPSTVAPSELLKFINISYYAVPRTYLTVPVKVLASDFSSITFAIFLIYSIVKFPLCLTI